MNFKSIFFIPVDSEHFSLWYGLRPFKSETIEKIYLTASGGPLFNLPLNKFKNISINQALKHPNWSMGKKISIDSATMMNKVYEVIEAKNIFNIKKKINIAKPNALVTAPSTAALNALKKKNIKKISVVTPYIKSLNDDVVNFFKGNNFEIVSNTYFGIESDVDIGKVDQNKLFEILSEIDHNQAQALFVSCTSLPVLNIIEKLEKKLNMIVLSSNQALIWETLEKINENKSVTGFGSLFN